MDIDKILEEREKTHGDASKGHDLMRMLQVTLEETMLESEMSSASKWEIHMALFRITRVICGDHTENDHWIDAQGYLELARRREARDGD